MSVVPEAVVGENRTVNRAPERSPGAATRGAQDRRLRTFFDSVPGLASCWDRDLHLVVANEAYRTWFGLDPDEIVGLHMKEVLTSEDYDRVLPFVELALGGEPQEFLRPVVDRHGITRHTQVSYVPDAADGEVQGLFVLVTDITSRVESQQLLEEAQELADLGSWHLDPATREITWSLQMYHITGTHPDSFTPTYERLTQMVHPQDRERLLSTAERAMAVGDGYDTDYRLVRPDGQVREVHSRVRADRAADGSVVRLNGIMQDVTATNRLARQMTEVNERLHRVNEINADVLAMVGHDVRQPVGLIAGHLELLLDTWSESSDEQRVQHLTAAQAAASRMTILIDDILTMANLDNGTITRRPEPTPVAEVVRDVLAGVHGGEVVDVEIHGAPVAHTDPFHLRQIVTNLVSNAIRYGVAPVVVSSGESDGRVWLDVVDHGQGVPEEFVPRMFERFSRAEADVPARTSGTGFGLYIARRLVEANLGEVSYRPNEPRGARFSVSLPTA